MQKLQLELKNVPGDASQVPCSTSLQLNRDQSLSVVDKVLDCNNPEVNLRQQTDGLKVKVFVLSINKKPLMPCSSAKARHLLQGGKAHVVKRSPFTIQLNFECENQVQDVVLGIDTGFGNIGFSAVSEKKELISGTLLLDGRTSERLTERKMYRNGRRSQLWYREPRFNNRIRKEGWLPPSVQRRYDTHLNLIDRIKMILPVLKIIIETAKFDIQKIMNLDIHSKEYQQGSMFGYQNMRSYLMVREHGKCQHCGKDFKDKPSHIHHCKQRSESGSNRPENLALIHKCCHEKIHKQGLKLSAPKEYKPNTFMSIIHKKFWDDIPDLQVTYGYETFVKRNELGLEKLHSNDAFVISNGGEQLRTKPFEIIQKHRNSRVLQLNRKGYKPSIKKSRSKIQPLDLFWIKGISYTCKGMFNYGKYICYGSTKLKEYFKISEVQKFFSIGSLVWN